MADETAQPDQEPPEENESGKVAALRARTKSALNWATGSRWRKVLVGGGALLLLGGTFAFWSYLAHLAVIKGKPVTIEMALEALDEQDYEKARTLVGRYQQQATNTESFGGALFVLGAVKANEAAAEWSVERQRASHLLAARYLGKARVLGVPEDRENQSLFLLGRSLIRGNQPAEGIALLEEALGDETLPSTLIHSLLSEAFLSTADPDFESALLHSQAVLSDAKLDEQDRPEVFVGHAEILLKLDRFQEATALLKGITAQGSLQARVKVAMGSAAIAAAEQLPVDNPVRAKTLKKALTDMREAQQLDSLSGKPTRQAMYWIGRCFELQDEAGEALVQYDRVSKQYGDTPEGLVATLAKAELHQAAGNIDSALVGYRELLEAAGDPVVYVNSLLPLSKLRKRLELAHRAFADAGHFEKAVALVEQFASVFDYYEVTKLRALTHQLWAKSKQDEALDAHRRDVLPLEKESRYHFRAAGRAFESLAELRFATAQYPKDLWSAAESYYQGQGYSHAVRMIEQYLQHEVQRHKARALLRLGQSLLATGQPKLSIRALEECIELYPRDADVYQARLECARAYLENVYQLRMDNLGGTQKNGWEKLEKQFQDRAEQLLLTNYTGDTLTPRSIQWQDSLFALGFFLHDSNRHLDAIRKLEEAVARYPDNKQTVLTNYIISRSFHIASQSPSQKLRSAKTESERQKNRKLRDHYLEKALEGYLAVQRKITIQSGAEATSLEKSLLRNCYMMQGSVLFQLRRFEEARKAFGNISTIYQDESFVLESFVHIANCWRRLNQPAKARGTIERAKLVLQRLPDDMDFKLSTNFGREEWKLLLNQMSKW